MDHNRNEPQEGVITANGPVMDVNTNHRRLPGEKGVSGTYMLGGIISDEEYNSKLEGKEGLDIFDQMRKSDATVRAALQAVKQPVLDAEWKMVASPDADAKEQKIAEDLQRGLDEDFKFKAFLREATNYLEFGHSVFEPVFEYTEVDGKPFIALTKMASRKQSSIYKWETDDHKPGIHQLTSTGFQADIPREQLMYLVHEQEGDNFEGVSFIRSMYQPWYMKGQIYKIMAMAVEKQGLGIPMLTAPKGAKDGEKKLARKAVQNMRANNKSYIELPEGWVVEMLDMKAGTRTDPMPFIQHLDHQILKSALVQFLDMGAHRGSGGTQGASGDQSQLLYQSLTSIANTIADAFNEDVVKQWVDKNYSNVKHYPKLTVSKIASEDLVAFATSIQSLTTAKVLTPDPDLEKSVREKYHLPDLPKEYEADYPNRPLSPEQQAAADQAQAELTLKSQANDPNAKPVKKTPANTKEKQASEILANAREMHTLLRQNVALL